jgi:hypothetical protein
VDSVQKLINSSRGKELTFIIASLSILVLLLISPAAASVSDWEFSPQKPVSGDTLSIKGSASPGEKIDVFVNFEKTVPVSGGKFEYILEDVKIPEGFNNIFKVEATGVKNLNVRVKIGIWMTKSSDASGTTAVVSQSKVPPGTYTMKIDGDAAEGASEVNLDIKASQGIEADSNGGFSYSYNTNAIPSENFGLQVGSITKEITIQPEGISGSTSESSSRVTTKTNSQPEEISGSTSGSSSGSTSGSSSGSSSGSTSGSTSGVTKKTNSQAGETSDSNSISSSGGSSSVKTGSSLIPTTSKTPDEKGVSKASTLGNLEEKDTQKQLSGKGTKALDSQPQSANIFYLLTGMGAGILILILYSRRK